ncbi:MAG: Eco57I restriction-modification methylase domain-containing protein, partial [Actinobacteria bacterium]|nr:Eco57I restriction-modification methylase domain-containing protein [Actinomycetota bacterium]
MLRRLGTQHIPDILDCLAQLSNDQVPTPPTLVRAMLDLLPEHVWSEPDCKWLDPCCKSGGFLREIAARLLDGLSKWEPDFEKRRQHIYRNMLFGTSITEMTGIISRRSLYCSRDASGDFSIVHFDDEAGNLPFVYAKHEFIEGRTSCVRCGAAPDIERGERRENYAYSFIHGAYPTKEIADMQFDVVVGNPPYQLKGGGGGTNDSPVYHFFVERAIQMASRYVLMITPSRWFTGGRGLDDFRQRMLNDRRLARIVDNPKLFDCFPGVEIKGGVSYFLWDREHDSDCEFSTRVDGVVLSSQPRDLRHGRGALIRSNEAAPIVEKVLAAGEATWERH